MNEHIFWTHIQQQVCYVKFTTVSSDEPISPRNALTWFDGGPGFHNKNIMVCNFLNENKTDYNVLLFHFTKMNNLFH